MPSYACWNGLECPGKAGQLQKCSVDFETDLVQFGEQKVKFKIDCQSADYEHTTYCAEFPAKVI